MPNPFPGMNPYLEKPAIWRNVHTRLIVALADDIQPRIAPQYYVTIEERTYVGEPVEGLSFTAYPDVAIIKDQNAHYSPTVAPPLEPTMMVELPIPEEIYEPYLEIRELGSNQVITILEILSPTNKRPGPGREIYEEKREFILGTKTHLVEIDLLRAGTSPTVFKRPKSHYAILISRSERRPKAELLPFNISQPIPNFQLPLQKGDDEPEVDLGRLLHELYDRAGYDLRVDYTKDPEPPLDEETAGWVNALLHDKGLRRGSKDLA